MGTEGICPFLLLSDTLTKFQSGGQIIYALYHIVLPQLDLKMYHRACYYLIRIVIILPSILFSAKGRNVMYVISYRAIQLREY